jgi:hypothetical protein
MKITGTGIFLFIITLLVLNGFEIRVISVNTIQIVNFAASLLMLVMSVPYFFRKSVGFVLPVQLLCFSMVMSVFMAYWSWGQSFLTSLKAAIPALQWIFFFYLYHKKVPVKLIEDIVLVFGVFYIGFFLFQFTHSGTVYFGWQDEFIEERGIIRVNFPGTGIFFMSNFIALNRFTHEKRNKLIWATYALTGVAVMVLQVTRQYIAVLAIIYLIHFLKNAHPIKKIIVLALFGVAIYTAVISDNQISRGLREEQKETVSQKGEYIRIVAGEYYLTQFSPSFINKVFGNGPPYNVESDLGKEVVHLQDRGFFLTDIGIIAIYASYGVVAVLAFLLIFLKSFTMPLPPRYRYLKYYIWMLLFTCLTSDCLFSDKTMITNIFVLYCYQVIYLREVSGETDVHEAENMDLEYSVYS